MARKKLPPFGIVELDGELNVEYLAAAFPGLTLNPNRRPRFAYYTSTSDGTEALIYYPDVSMTRVGGIEMPAEFWAFIARTDRRPYALLMRVEDGSLNIEALVLGRRRGESPINVKDIRAVKLGEFRETVGALTGIAAKLAAGERGFTWTASDTAAAAASIAAADPPRRGRRVSDEELMQVAELYRQALRKGVGPTDFVCRELGHISRPTAGRWVKWARERGFLGPTTPGVAGEKAQPATTSRKRPAAPRRKKERNTNG